MQQYIDTETGFFPLTENEIRQSSPSTLFPQPFQSNRFKPIVNGPTIPFDIWTETLVTDGVECVDGIWQYKWKVVNLPAEAIEAKQAEHVQHIKSTIVNAAQVRLDEFARTRNYDSILSAITYANDPNPKFKSEALQCIKLRSQTWATLYALMAEVEAGNRPMPNDIDDFSGLLPELTWENTSNNFEPNEANT